jgi:hypothetical protein
VTVSELIEKLREYPQNQVVNIWIAGKREPGHYRIRHTMENVGVSKYYKCTVLVPSDVIVDGHAYTEGLEE